MKRVKRGILSLVLVAGLALVAVSCGGTGASTDVPPTVLVKPSPTASVSASSSSSAGPAAAPDPDDPRGLKVAAWTDPVAVAGLAKDCHWDPGKCLATMEESAPRSIEVGEYPVECEGLWPLACARIPGQSCVPDACSQSNYDCYPACDKSCTDCGGKCITSCESCKSTCEDDACKLACATKCAECHQSCVKELDHCTTAVCSEKEETCFRERDDAWMKSACPKVCPRVQSCVEKCPEVENDPTGSKRYRTPCVEKCLSRLGKGCPATFDDICAGDPNMSANFNIYHQNRAATGK